MLPEQVEPVCTTTALKEIWKLVSMMGPGSCMRRHCGIRVKLLLSFMWASGRHGLPECNGEGGAHEVRST